MILHPLRAARTPNIRAATSEFSDRAAKSELATELDGDRPVPFRIPKWACPVDLAWSDEDQMYVSPKG